MKKAQEQRVTLHRNQSRKRIPDALQTRLNELAAHPAGVEVSATEAAKLANQLIPFATKITAE